MVDLMFTKKKTKIKRFFIIFMLDYFDVKKKFDFVKKDLTLSRKFVIYSQNFFIFSSKSEMKTFKIDELQKRLIGFFKQNIDQEGLTLREIANEV